MKAFLIFMTCLSANGQEPAQLDAIFSPPSPTMVDSSSPKSIASIFTSHLSIISATPLPPNYFTSSISDSQSQGLQKAVYDYFHNTLFKEAYSRNLATYLQEAKEAALEVEEGEGNESQPEEPQVMKLSKDTNRFGKYFYDIATGLIDRELKNKRISCETPTQKLQIIEKMYEYLLQHVIPVAEDLIQWYDNDKRKQQYKSLVSLITNRFKCLQDQYPRLTIEIQGEANRLLNSTEAALKENKVSYPIFEAEIKGHIKFFEGQIRIKYKEFKKRKNARIKKLIN
ncbi:hypothetical protein [Candidatus Odyssella thessalonicensis]|uniref:hypothetical protein n=1 Tax=Candidatus Odyssella thessalonicensis TaxID=84647 RepID=UPI000225C0C7|nr:hypothetical protein [Candidatus Odyssella thessalonicensis]